MRLSQKLVQASSWEGLVSAHWGVELGLVPLVGRAVSGGCLPGRFFTQEDFKQPVCWWVGVCSCPVGCLVWGIPELGPTGYWVGTGISGKMAAFKRAHATEYSSVSLSLQSATATATSTGDPPIPAVSLVPSLMRSLLFSWVLVHTRPDMHPPTVEFLFPSVLWNSCNQTPLAFKARFSGGSSSHWQTPSLWSLTWGSELSLLWENFCGIIIFQFVGHPPSVMGFDYIVTVPFLPSHCGFFFVFGCRVYFLVGSSIFFVNGCSAVNC